MVNAQKLPEYLKKMTLLKQPDTMTKPRTFTTDEKGKIAIELMGLDIDHMRGFLPSFDHIPEVLKKYDITPGEANNILLEKLEMFSPSDQEKIIKPIREQYLAKLDTEALSLIDNVGPTLLKWNNTKTDLCELIEALSSANSIQIKGKAALQKDIVKAFEMIFDIDLKNFHSLLIAAKKRYKRKEDRADFLTKLSNHIQPLQKKKSTDKV